MSHLDADELPRIEFADKCIIKIHIAMRKPIILLSFGVAAAAVIAENPYSIIQTSYTADPAPMVFNDTVYLYTNHDEDDADGFKMYDWLLYTSTDMVNWTDCGSVASLKDFKWNPRDNGAWAAQVVECDGKFYMYCADTHGDLFRLDWWKFIK